MNSIRYFNTIQKLGLSILLVLFVSKFSFSQVDSTFKHINLNYNDYMNKVVSGNLELLAEKYNVNIADAKIEAAKIFQDPSLSFDWDGNHENKSMVDYSLSAEISKTFELGQKRKARINLAKSERLLTSEMLNYYLQNLQADATIDYLSALKHNYLFDVMLDSYRMMKKLSDADSIRYRLGSIKAIDAAQSKIEAGVLRNDLFQIEADRRSSIIKLAIETSTFRADTVFQPIGDLGKYERFFSIDDLLVTALNNRADLMAAKSNIAFNQNFLTLTKRERITDIDLKLGTSNTYLNDRDFSPAATEVYAGIAIPLKFSNFNKGELKVAQFQVEQAETLYRQVEMNIQNEVMQAYGQYMSLCKQVKNYDQGLLEQSKIVLNGKVYSYSRGETSLLEVLNAQRTFNDLQNAYYETLYNCNAALVELERAVGIWDIEL